jgi:hypothetical protein
MRVGDIFGIERAGRSAAESGCQLSQEQYLAIERARQTITALRQLQQAIQTDDDRRGRRQRACGRLDHGHRARWRRVERGGDRNR